MTPSTVTPQDPDAQSARSMSDEAQVQQRQASDRSNIKRSSTLAIKMLAIYMRLCASFVPGKSTHAVTMCRDFCRPFEITKRWQGAG